MLFKLPQDNTEQVPRMYSYGKVKNRLSMELVRIRT